MASPIPTVLIVDDDDHVRGLIREVLVEEGYGVVEAKSGPEAEALVKTLSPPLVLLVDLLMPQVDGWEFIEAVRSDERMREVPVVVMSSSISIQRIPERVTFLQKPFKLQRLLGAIRQAHSA